MANYPKDNTYVGVECAVFCKTKDKHGGLSNMAGGFPLRVNGIDIKTSEALYQACRFPDNHDLQREIIKQHSPMAAKMKSKPHRGKTRKDWEEKDGDEEVRVVIMRWCLKVKLAQNWNEFGNCLKETGDRLIVELSRKNAFWGAKPTEYDTLVGMNVLGKLLMELRDEVARCEEPLLTVEPLNIPNFRLYSEKIKTVSAADKPPGLFAS